MGHEVAEALPGIVEVLGLRPVPKLLPDRPPEALAFPERLGMVGTGDDVTDPLAVEQLLEGALPPPREVLPTLVREHLARLPEGRDPRKERLRHDLLLLMEMEPEAHDVAARVIQEHDEVDAPALACEHEARDVGLPQLRRTRPLEAARRLPLRPGLAARKRKTRDPLLPEDLRHRARRDAHPDEAQEHVPHPPCAEVRVLRLRLDDRGFDRGGKAARIVLRGGLPLAGLQSLRAFLPVTGAPVTERLRAHPPRATEVARREPRLRVGLDRLAAFLGSVRS
jgi:hypothetical protein